MKQQTKSQIYAQQVLEVLKENHFPFFIIVFID